MVEFNQRVLDARDTQEGTAFEDQYYRTLMRMEAGDPSYEWVNHRVFVTEGRISPGKTGRGIEVRTFVVT